MVRADIVVFYDRSAEDRLIVEPIEQMALACVLVVRSLNMNLLSDGTNEENYDG